MAIINKTDNNTCWEDVEKLEPDVGMYNGAAVLEKFSSSSIC